MTPKPKIGGARRGAGRKAGGRNRATIEKAEIAAKMIAEAAGRPGRALAKHKLEEFAEMFAGVAAAFQPVGTGPGGAVTGPDMETWGKSFKEPLFEKYAKLASKCFGEVADFQSPRMGTVQVPAPPPDNRGPNKKKFTVGIFDGQGRKAPRHITVKPNSSTTKNVTPAAMSNGKLN
jgi:hypothetical protein